MTAMLDEPCFPRQTIPAPDDSCAGQRASSDNLQALVLMMYQLLRADAGRLWAMRTSLMPRSRASSVSIQFESCQ